MFFEALAIHLGSSNRADPIEFREVSQCQDYFRPQFCDQSHDLEAVARCRPIFCRKHPKMMVTPGQHLDRITVTFDFKGLADIRHANSKCFCASLLLILFPPCERTCSDLPDVSWNLRFFLYNDACFSETEGAISGVNNGCLVVGPRTTQYDVVSLQIRLDIQESSMAIMPAHMYMSTCNF